ncbi:MAG: serine--tRNA ligase [Saprospiraceae bacterium]|jgi:seryl-tRNA synthetase|nr:serine--tRNA ligase [Saprospiraceae bacterium]MCF8299500.1 serine--tRNA ligase [Haliscomenobacter sp.]
MLQISVIRQNQSEVIEGLGKKNVPDAAEKIAEIIQLDDQRKQWRTELEKLLTDRNQFSDEVGKRYKEGDKEGADAIKVKVNALKDKTAELELLLGNIEKDLDGLLYLIPNLPHASVPQGKTPDDNEVFQAWAAELPVLNEQALPHWDLAKKYNLFDLELGVKITGSGFPVYRGKGAKLQRALIQFFLDEAVNAGYEEIMPPLLVNEASATATGQLPDKEGQMYYVAKDDLYLIPTAEVPITNILRDVILDAAKLPVKMCGYTPCFRREAGSYGAHVRGLNRVHQFDKVEVVQVAHPDNSYQVFDQMIQHVSQILDKLELPYRILRLCGGDMSFASALTYDFEVYSAGQKRWLEVSSVSNFETFQSNRLKLRFKDGKQSRLAHTLNGSALALARIVAALLENNQTADGIVIPKALIPYTGFDHIS